jgi:hypothetical protein
VNRLLEDVAIVRGAQTESRTKYDCRIIATRTDAQNTKDEV